jgi:hypothetical protein
MDEIASLFAVLPPQNNIYEKPLADSCTIKPDGLTEPAAGSLTNSRGAYRHPNRKRDAFYLHEQHLNVDGTGQNLTEDSPREDLHPYKKRRKSHRSKKQRRIEY